MVDAVKRFDDKLSNKSSLGFLVIIVILFITAMVFIANRYFSHILIIDESLYINAARSLHFEGKLLYHAQPSVLAYSLYPAILSVAYFFYSPDSIMLIMRIIGILTYSIGFIPVFLLARNITESPLKALLITVFAMLIPENINALYIMQEITHFPLMMSAFYLFYMTIQDKPQNPAKPVLYHTILGVVMALLCESKAVGIVMVFAYMTFSLVCICCAVYRKEQVRSNLVKFVYVVVPFIAVMTIASVIKTNIYNNTGYNLQESAPSLTGGIIGQLNQVWEDFPGFISEYITGTFMLLFYFLIAIFVLPVVVPVMGFRELDNGEKKLLFYTAGITVVTIIIIVLTIYVPEKGYSADYQRAHLRYLYYMYIPILILSVKLIGKRLCVNACSFAVVLFLLIYALVRYDRLTVSFGDINNIALTLTGTLEPILGIVAVSLLAVVFIMIKKDYILSAKIYIFSSVIVSVIFGINSIFYFQHIDILSGNKYDYIDIARSFERDDNILLIDGSVWVSNPEIIYDSVILQLDGFLASDANYMIIDDLISYGVVEPNNSDDISKIQLYDIIPGNFPYKQSFFSLGDIDYIITNKANKIINAEILPVSETSALFNVYKVNTESSTVDFVVIE